MIETLCDVDITTAVTGTVPGNGTYTTFTHPYLDAASFMAVFDSGSGGTTAKCWVQTSVDGGASWVDVAAFAFTTSHATKISSITRNIAPAAQAWSPTDGSLTDDTIAQGFLGNRWRVKVTTTGTYTAANLKVYMAGT